MSRNILLIVWFLAGVLMFVEPAHGQVAVNEDDSAPDSSAMLELKSTSLGFLPPRMSTAERDAIPSPAEGLIIYNSDAKGLNLYNGSSWGTLSGAFQCGLSQVTDVEGNSYNTVTIGRLCWMASNLNTGVKLDLPTPQSNNGIIEKYCYNDSVENCNTYGGLYSWNEMMNYTHTSGSQGICPDGWHVATPSEYNALIAMFGGADTAGAALKEAGYAHWYPWSAPSTNASRFTALPGGKVVDYGSGPEFIYINGLALFWISNWDGTVYADALQLLGYNSVATLYGADTTIVKAGSVRCVRLDP